MKVNYKTIIKQLDLLVMFFYGLFSCAKYFSFIYVFTVREKSFVSFSFYVLVVIVVVVFIGLIFVVVVVGLVVVVVAAAHSVVVAVVAC